MAEEKLARDVARAASQTSNLLRITRIKCLSLSLFRHALGIATTMGSWKPQMEYFSSLPSYQCCYIDNRGVGLSSAPVGAYSAHQMANDSMLLVNELGWKSYHLVGLSMGGMIALELALIDTRILTLTLMVTHAGGANAYIPISGLSILMNYRPGFTALEYTMWILPLLYSKKWRSSKYIDENGNETDKTNQDIVIQELLELRQNNPQKFVGLLGQFVAVASHWVSYQSLLSLRKRGIPTLILCAQRDKLVRPENSYVLNKILKPYRFVEYEGCGHMIHRERAKEVNQELHTHFESVYRYNLAQIQQQLQQPHHHMHSSSKAKL